MSNPLRRVCAHALSQTISIRIFFLPRLGVNPAAAARKSSYSLEWQLDLLLFSFPPLSHQDSTNVPQIANASSAELGGIRAAADSGLSQLSVLHSSVKMFFPVI